MKQFFLLVVGMSVFGSAQAGAGRWEVLDATYSVPVPAELAPFAAFPGMKVKQRLRAGRRELTYELPVELTGRPVEVHARDVDGRGVHFVGELSDMTCTPTDCLARYPGLQLDAAEVRSALETKGVQGQELQARMAVFARFDGGDPAGVIHFENPGR